MTVALFAADDGVDGYELLSTDGTTGHTGIVKDIAPGTASSQPQDLVLFNGAVYFDAYDQSGTQHLWKSDGTAAGTVAITSGNIGTSPTHLTVSNGRLFFSADTYVNGNFTEAAFSTDGSVGGTVMLTQGYVYSPFYSTTSKTFFTVLNASAKVELWSTDGTPGGTAPILVPSGSNADTMQGFVTAGSHLFFAATDANDVNSLWVSDGTAAGTTTLLHPGFIFNLTGVGSKAFFSTDTSNVCVSDGTTQGTMTLTGSTVNSTRSFTSFNNLLYFVATDESPTSGNSDALFVSDGTTTGTKVVKDASGIVALTKAGSLLYFFAYDPTKTSQMGIWKSDGTAAGTVFVADVYSSTYNMTAVGSKVFFVLNDQVHGDELWASDGTAAGTGLVQDINPGSASSNPANITDFNGKAIFSATTASGGTELYISDGTAAGTMLVKDINAGTTSGTPNSSNPSGFVVLPTGTPVAGFDAKPSFINGGGSPTLSGTVSDTVALTSVKVFNDTSLLGTATIDNSAHTWTLTLTLAAGFYSSINVVLTDATGSTATATASFALQTGITGQPYVTIVDDIANGQYTGQRYIAADGTVYLQDTLSILANGDTAYYFYSGSYFVGQSFTAYQNELTSAGVLVLQTVYNSSTPIRQTTFNADGSIYLQATITVLANGNYDYHYASGSFFNGLSYVAYDNVTTSAGLLLMQTRYKSGNVPITQITYNSDASIYLQAAITVLANGNYDYHYASGSFFIGLSYASYDTITTSAGLLLMQTRYNSSGVAVQQTTYNSDGSVYLLATISVVASTELNYHYASGSFFTGLSYVAYDNLVDASGVLLTQTRYNAGGATVEFIRYNSDGSVFLDDTVTTLANGNYDYHYFAGTFLTTLGYSYYDTITTAGGVPVLQTYYATNGMLIKQITFNSDGSVYQQYTVSKLANGNIDYHYATGSFFTGKTFASFDNITTAAGALVSQTLYNTGGLVIQQTQFNANGSIYLQDTVTRLSNGNVDTHFAGGSFFTGKTFVAFDNITTAAGALVSQTLYNASGLAIQQTQYNANGSLYLQETATKLSNGNIDYHFAGGTFFTGKSFAAFDNVETTANVLVTQTLLDGTGAPLQITAFNANGSVYEQATVTKPAAGQLLYHYAGGSFFAAQSFSSFDNLATTGGALLYQELYNKDGSHGFTVPGSNLTLTAAKTDTFTATGSNDTVRFNATGFGADVFNGYKSGDSFSFATSVFASYTALSQHVTGTTSAVITTAANDTLTISNVAPGNLSAAMFKFA